jgi:hypothetical protein
MDNGQAHRRGAAAERPNRWHAQARHGTARRPDSWRAHTQHVLQGESTEHERVLEAPLPQGDMAEHTPKVLSQGSLTEGMVGCDCDMLPQEGTTACEHELKMPLRGVPIECRHTVLPRQEGVGGTPECRPTRGHPTEGAHGPNRPSRVGASKRTWLLGEAMLEATPKTALEARGTCQPKRKPPWEAIPKSRRPFGASKSERGRHHHCLPKTHLATENPSQHGSTISGIGHTPVPLPAPLPIAHFEGKLSSSEAERKGP